MWFGELIFLHMSTYCCKESHLSCEEALPNIIKKLALFSSKQMTQLQLTLTTPAELDFDTYIGVYIDTKYVFILRSTKSSVIFTTQLRSFTPHQRKILFHNHMQRFMQGEVWSWEALSLRHQRFIFLSSTLPTFSEKKAFIQKDNVFMLHSIPLVNHLPSEHKAASVFTHLCFLRQLLMVQTSTVPSLESLHKTNKRSKKAPNQPLGKEGLFQIYLLTL